MFVKHGFEDLLGGISLPSNQEQITFENLPGLPVAGIFNEGSDGGIFQESLSFLQLFSQDEQAA